MSEASFDPGRASSTLSRDATGIWTPSAEDAASRAAISFPEEGHGDCFAIEDDSFWFSHRNTCIELALARYPFEGAFLDVGGGNGAVSKHLASKGVEAVVLEPGPAGAMNAKKRGLDNVICATIEQAAFQDGSFGGAGLFDVIEHVLDDVRMVREVRKVLPRNGTLCVTVPAYAALWSAEDELAGHHRRYTVASLERVLEACGFAVEYATYFFAPLTVPLFVLRSVRYRLSKGRPADVAAARAQHTPGRAARVAMELALAPERSAIARGARIPFGTSCLAIARAV